MASATILRFVSQQTQARRYFISGIVQGVGFRFFAQQAARRFEVAGYARNLPDGRVEAYAVGAPRQLDAFRRALERGPSGASVSGVTEESAAVDSRYAKGFSITFA